MNDFDKALDLLNAGLLRFFDREPVQVQDHSIRTLGFMRIEQEPRAGASDRDCLTCALATTLADNLCHNAPNLSLSIELSTTLIRLV